MVVGIVLAAGVSSRMGRPKQLLDWGGRPLVRAVAEAALAAELDHLIVVTGAAGAAVAAALADLRLRIVPNPEYAAGQSFSLRAGVAALPPETAAAVVLLGDQPFVTAPIIMALVNIWRRERAPIVAPLFGGVRGNPVLFDRALFDELLDVTGDQGARGIIARDPARVRLAPFDDPRPLLDIDTPEAYARAHALLDAQP